MARAQSAVKRSAPRKAQQFEAKLELMGAGGAWTCLRVPFSVPEVFGSKARVAVKGSINRFAFHASLFPMSGGEYFMIVNKAMQKGARAQAGDTVTVVLEKDVEPRTLPIPEDLGKALARDRQAKAAFDKMSYSHKKEYVDWVESAKRAETRISRIEKTVKMVAEQKRLKA